MAVMSLITIKIPYIGTITGEPPVVASRDRRRMTAKRDKAKYGRYKFPHHPGEYESEGKVMRRESREPAPDSLCPTKSPGSRMTVAEAKAVRDYRAMKAAEVIWNDFQRGLH